MCEFNFYLEIGEKTGVKQIDKVLCEEIKIPLEARPVLTEVSKLLQLKQEYLSYLARRDLFGSVAIARGVFYLWYLVWFWPQSSLVRHLGL